MALVACKKCGNQISEFAQACPKCGEPQIKGEVQPIVPEIPIETKVETTPKVETAQPEISAQTTVKVITTGELPQPERKKKKLLPIILFSILGVGLILVILFSLGVFDQGTQSTDSSPSNDRNYNNSNDQTSDSNGEVNDEQDNDEQYEEDYEPEDEVIEDYEGEEVSVKDVENNIGYYADAKVDYRQRLITGVYDIQVAVTNNSPYTMKSLRVEVQYQRLNNKVFDWEYLSFSNIAPYSTVTMDAPNKSEGSFVAVQVIEGKVSK